MANLHHLEQFAKDIIPILKDLFTKASGGGAAPDPAPANEAVAKLKKLIAEASVPTPATNTEAAEAVTAIRSALFEVIKSAAASPVALAPTDVNTIDALFTALGNRAGLLLEQAAFATIPSLIPPANLQRIQEDVQRADQEIRNRQGAKQVLDAVVKTIIVAAQIAAKLAI